MLPNFLFCSVSIRDDLLPVWSWASLKMEKTSEFKLVQSQDSLKPNV